MGPVSSVPIWQHHPPHSSPITTQNVTVPQRDSGGPNLPENVTRSTVCADPSAGETPCVLWVTSTSLWADVRSSPPPVSTLTQLCTSPTARRQPPQDVPTTTVPPASGTSSTTLTGPTPTVTHSTYAGEAP